MKQITVDSSMKSYLPLQICRAEFDLRIMRGRGREGHTCVLVKRGCVQKEPGIIIVISDQKWPLKKRPIIAHIKARSNHPFSISMFDVTIMG